VKPITPSNMIIRRGLSLVILLFIYYLSCGPKYRFGLEKVCLSNLSMNGLLKLKFLYVFIFSIIPWYLVTYWLSTLFSVFAAFIFCGKFNLKFIAD
jgi:hypothetical protein